MRDPKIAIADKLSSQDGANSFHVNSDSHNATIGAHNINDAVEVRERAHTHVGNFGRYDHVLHRFRNVSTESASGVAQEMLMHDFDDSDAAARRK
eukprot:404782-Pleurochrysis_carterae.AAC.1